MGTEKITSKPKKQLNRFRLNGRPGILAALKRVPTSIKISPEVRRVSNALQQAKESFASHFESTNFDNNIDKDTLIYLNQAYDAVASAVCGK